ncbi:AAA family ATPase [Mesorhizobium kowhaii]|uniref:AAA family ATPase n=1 Tax=Mesorhizobium kowhaii TaxID=1300272 RepID=UPI0035F080BF
MIDEGLFWSLPGPSGFIDDIAEAVTKHGVAAIQAPLYRAPGLSEAVIERLENDGYVPVYTVPSGARGPIIHRLAVAGGEMRMSMRTAGSLIDKPEFRGAAFLIKDINTGEWDNWVTFFRSYSAEWRRRSNEALKPALVALVPPDVPKADLDRLFPAALVRWSGRVSSFDMRTYISRRTGRFTGLPLLEKVAIEVAIRLSGYDPRLAEYLVTLDPVSAVDPWDTLKAAYGGNADVRPCWGNGLVDTIDGDVYIHTASLIAANDRKAFDIRRWRAVSGPVLDFNATVCRHFADVYANLIDAKLPWRVALPFGEKIITNRYDMENSYIRECLGSALEEGEIRFLKQTAKARNNIAHNDIPVGALINTLSTTWKTYASSSKKETVGWNWPRCGQKLVMMVGPSGAGKSTFAKTNYPPDEIISADAVREQLFGSAVVAGPQAKIFKVVTERLVAKLSRGESAVLDATNIKKRDRLNIVDLIPEDIKVEYVVLDRNMDDKRRDGGWRNGRDGLLEGHAEIFAAEIADILAGDQRPNILVTDQRLGNTK